MPALSTELGFAFSNLNATNTINRTKLLTNILTLVYQRLINVTNAITNRITVQR